MFMHIKIIYCMFCHINKFIYIIKIQFNINIFLINCFNIKTNQFKYNFNTIFCLNLQYLYQNS